MNALRKRILELLRAVNMTDKDVAKAMKATGESSDQQLKQFLYQSEKNATRDMKFRTVVKIAEITGGSIKWLATGEPPMLEAGQRQPATAKDLALQLARKMVERGEAGDGAYDMLVADEVPPGDKDVRYWMDRFMEYIAIEREYSERAKRASEGKSDPPSAPTIRIRRR